MTYNSSRQALKELGRDAKFEDDIGHYNYRRWVANKVNCMSCRVEDVFAKQKNLKLYLT
jgi:hypothetical protein